MSLCVIGAATLRLAVTAFTLGWTHSVQKTPWEEDWTVGPTTLQIVEARIQSMGAGMETPPGARFDGTWWHWAPHVPPLPEVLLRRSDAVPQGWTLCADGKCQAIGDADEKADIVTLRPCE